MDFTVGQTFGDYRILHLLRASSTGSVYKVEHRITKRTEAMEVLPTEVATETQIERFEREMRVLARLNHPHIAALHNAIRLENQLVLFTEFLEGRTLESMLKSGRLTIDAGVGYIKQILSALQYAHEQGVVHRDVTPGHVIVTPGGQVKLTDFRLAKSLGDPALTNYGEILGSLPYLAPEHVKGRRQPDRRSDLYSVGAILYELVTGRKPFGERRTLAPILTDSECEPPPPSKLDATVTRQWDKVIHRSLARNPTNRFYSAEEFLGALGQLDQPSAERFIRQHARSLALGVAVASWASTALVWPAMETLGPVEPISVPLRQSHILPPAFAIIAKPRNANPQDRVAKPVNLAIVRPHHSQAHSDHAVLAPSLIEVSKTNEDVLIGSGEEPVSDSADVKDVKATLLPKKTFWSRLNIFKRRHGADLEEKQ
jgi:eukaryotic-like serine/threonine-protein kinase